MLSEAVERLIIRRLEHLSEGISLGSFHFYRLKGLSAACLLGQDRITFKVSEPHFSSGHAHTCNNCRRTHRNHTVIFVYGKLRRTGLRHYDQALGICELPVRRRRHMDELVAKHFKPYKARSAFCRFLDFHGHSGLVLPVGASTRSKHESSKKKRKDSCLHIGFGYQL